MSAERVLALLLRRLRLRVESCATCRGSGIPYGPHGRPVAPKSCAACSGNGARLVERGSRK